MSLKQTIVGQFRQPHGLLGQLAGVIMARRPSNIERIEWTLDLLALRPTDFVLEIGFGPGIAIEKAARVVTDGVVVGIDHSETMLHQGKKRNAVAIAQGRVQLHLASGTSLPHFGQTFDKILSINVVQFWDDPVAIYRSLRQSLSTGGLIATTYMPRLSGATEADARQMADETMTHLVTAGFDSIRVEEKAIESVPTVCVLATKA